MSDIASIAGVVPAAYDGAQLRRMLEGGSRLLSRRSAAINNLNVFPVPDGDTGTNMLLTMRAAILAAEEVAGSGVGVVAAALAHGALMGARGNSGVILSQYLRGFARPIGDAAEVDGVLFAAALMAAGLAARAAVSNPVEGTMLTVATDLAEAASRVAATGAGATDVLDAAVAEARDSVRRTRDLLPILREADVVDSGGMGLATILEGMAFVAHDEELPENEEEVLQAVAVRLEKAEYGYCTQFLIHGAMIDLAAVRAELSPLGDSLLVVGDEEVVRVHLHTFQPGRAIDLALAHGGADRITIDNMQEQNAHAREFAPTGEVDEVQTALVVVSTGNGFRDLFRSLGATVIPGGQTLNPSADELLRGLKSVVAREYVLLPNNPNVILTAQQARSMFDKPLEVLPTRNLAEGVAAALVFQPDGYSKQNAGSMSRAVSALRTAMVTTAVRNARIDGFDISTGQILGLIDDRIEAIGETVSDVTMNLLDRLDAGQFEIITVYSGADMAADVADGIRSQISHSFTGKQVELVHGGQPHYLLILACE